MSSFVLIIFVHPSHDNIVGMFVFFFCSNVTFYNIGEFNSQLESFVSQIKQFYEFIIRFLCKFKCTIHESTCCANRYQNNTTTYRSFLTLQFFAANIYTECQLQCLLHLL